MRWKKKKKKKEKLTRVNMVPWYAVPKQNSVLYSFKRPWVVHAFLTQYNFVCSTNPLVSTSMEGIPYYMYIALSHLFTSKKANFKFRNDVAQLQVEYVERS